MLAISTCKKNPTLLYGTRNTKGMTRSLWPPDYKDGTACRLFKSGTVERVRCAPCSVLVLVSPLDWHMHDVWISPRHPPELYFLIARFLEGGPCQQAAEVCSNSVQFLAENAFLYVAVAVRKRLRKLHFFCIFFHRFWSASWSVKRCAEFLELGCFMVHWFVRKVVLRSQVSFLLRALVCNGVK